MKYDVRPGARIGRLTVVERVVHCNDVAPKWRCLCSCGKIKLVTEKKLRYGEVLSCGCLQKARAHGASAAEEGCQKKDCMYHSPWGCAYFIVNGHTRTSLHLGENVDINNPCREYTPGEKDLAKRKPFTLGRDYY